jgi:hypothetical protein
LMTKAELNQQGLYDIDNWFLTRGDSDTSMFEDPNL